MSDRRALLVGINSYALPGADLEAPVADVTEMEKRLGRHADNKPNYDCRVLADCMEDGTPITRGALRGAVEALFANLKGDALLYFSGHGALTGVDGWLVTADGAPNDLGIPLAEIFQLATNASTAHNVLIILDCCHAGAAGNAPILNRPGAVPVAAIREDMAVMAASRDVQLAYEAGGHGLFTAAILDALDGGAADHMGWVTASSIYSYVERRFNSWGQRPVFKSHATRSHVVRECAPLIERQKLHELVTLFPTHLHKYALDPEYDPEDEHGQIKGVRNEEKLRISLLLKDYRDAGLVKASIAGEQFYWTARRGHTVELTTRGREYWGLVKANRI